ncbi:hypothetical protein ACH4FX_32250 [Streptomyces sp. NPDC018019]|uniref:hypothetical protein n=1 Tax=Streptomyces sp. NPDC018019 TaxID=3365030 RepID=UPI0037B1EB3F
MPPEGLGHAGRQRHVPDLLDAEPERFATALDDVHRRLTERIEDLIARRGTLHRLTQDDRALLPDRACAVLDRLAGRGWAAGTWEPDDPRIEEPASALADKLLANRALPTMPDGYHHQSDAAARYALVNHHREDQAPPIARLNALIEANLRAAGIEVPCQ